MGKNLPAIGILGNVNLMEQNIIFLHAENKISQFNIFDFFSFQIVNCGFHPYFRLRIGDYRALVDVDFKNKHCYFGAYTDPHSKNIGIGFLLFQTIIKLAFDVFKLHSLRGSTFATNPILYIHKKLGFKEVGKYSEYTLRNGKWLDVVITEIINNND